MKALVLFYSFSGKTKAVAHVKAQELGADIIEVKEAKKRSVFGAYTRGCFQAIKQKKTDIEPLDVDFDIYEKIVIMMPIWASSPAPAFNNVIEMLPSGKELELIMVSGSGRSNKEKTVTLLQDLGLAVLNYSDIKL